MPEETEVVPTDQTEEVKPEVIEDDGETVAEAPAEELKHFGDEGAATVGHIE